MSASEDVTSYIPLLRAERLTLPYSVECVEITVASLRCHDIDRPDRAEHSVSLNIRFDAD